MTGQHAGLALNGGCQVERNLSARITTGVGLPVGGLVGLTILVGRSWLIGQKTNEGWAGFSRIWVTSSAGTDYITRSAANLSGRTVRLTDFVGTQGELECTDPLVAALHLECIVLPVGAEHNWHFQGELALLGQIYKCLLFSQSNRKSS